MAPMRDRWKKNQTLEEAQMMTLARELFAYVGARRKWWLLPIVLVVVIFGGILILAQGSAVAPFIYTIF
jgi:Family of unknown function (DUF5989)